MTYRTFDIASPAYKRDPYPTLRAMIDEGPIVRIRYPLIGSFLAATRYEGVQDLLRGHGRFVRDPRSAGLKKGSNLPWWLPRSMRAMTEGMITRDEPDHRRLRALVEQAFVRRNIEQLRPRFTEIASQMIDKMEADQASTGRPVDLVAGLARPFPLAVICELLGLPAADRPMFIAQAESLADKPTVLGALKMLAGLRGMTFYPEQKNALAADWSRAGRAIDEILRYISPVQTTKPMMAVRDFQWQGHQLRRGERILAMLASANVDPGQFSDPERFDIQRHPNPHVAFGAGPHICLGLKLAVAEAHIAFEQLFTRFPTLELAVPPSEVEWSRRPGTRGMDVLPVRLR